MSVWSKWFGSKKVDRSFPRFGRFSDTYKSHEKYDKWDQAQSYYSAGEYVRSLLTLVDYITHDNEENIRLLPGHGVRFSFLQGSKRIDARVEKGLFRAECRIAAVLKRSEEWMEQLLESNYDLQYCRYSMDHEGHIKLVFDSDLSDLNPHKFYFALRELGILADKMDDLLLSSFPNLETVDNQHVLEYDRESLDRRWFFLKEKLSQLWSVTENLDMESSSDHHWLSYYILDTVYRIDYFLRPQGRLMDVLERVHNLYFSMGHGDSRDKNLKALAWLEEIDAIPEKEMKREFYEVIHTFGLISSVGQETVKAMIHGEMNHLQWYSEKNVSGALTAIAGYILGFTLFSYSPPLAMKRTMELYFRIMEDDFVSDLNGWKRRFRDAEGEIDVRAVHKELKRIVSMFSRRFPELYLDLDHLCSKDPDEFSLQFIEMIYHADWTENI